MVKERCKVYFGGPGDSAWIVRGSASQVAERLAKAQYYVKLFLGDSDEYILANPAKVSFVQEAAPSDKV